MRTTRGFTLIELMIVIAIIAILAAIAIPAYQDYVIRAKLTEGFSAAMGVKAAIGAAYNTGGTTNVTRVAGDYPPNNSSTGSKYVQYIEVSDEGVITSVVSATAANGIPTSLDGHTFTLTPQLANGGTYVALDDDLDGRMDWACASSTNVVAEARGMLSTAGTLAAKYLPAECR